MSARSTSPRRIWPRARTIAWLSAVTVLVFGAGWLAALAVAGPVQPVEDGAEPAMVVARTGVLEERISLRASLVWRSRAAVRNGASGTVTAVHLALESAVDSGAVVYEVDERPVVAVVGDVPWYRPLTGGERGADVRQLQDHLIEQQLLDGAADGEYGAGTRAAVRRWQADLGVARTGTVAAGDLVVVPGLPARLVGAEALEVGARLSGGEVVMARLPDVPSLQLVVAPDQSEHVRAGARIEVELDGRTRQGMLGPAIEQEAAQGDSVELVHPLVDDDGAPLCDADCVQVAEPDETVSIPMELVVVPRTEGIVVPMSAITTDGAATTVRTPAGATLEIEVVQHSRGLAVVDGVEAGTKLLLPDVPGEPRPSPVETSPAEAP